MAISTDMESLWLLALASKCQSFTPIHVLSLLFLFVLSYLVLNIVFWAHPGGPAWGKHKWITFNCLLSKNSVIPGPHGFPIIGSINLLAGLAHHKIAAAAHRHATRLMAFSIGHTRAIVTCDARVAKEILNSSNFSDRPANETAYSLMFNRSMGFAPYGVYWSMLRKIASNHFFCPKQIKASEKQRLEIANQVVSVLASKGRGDIRVRDVLKSASLNNMMSSVFGQEYKVGSELEELHDLVDQGYKLLGEVNWSDHLPFLAEFDLQKIRFRCARIVPRVQRFVGKIIAEHKATPASERNRDFVDVLLSLQGPDRLSDSDMIAVLWEMIFRGTDTVAILIEWILARLVNHPEVQSKVHAELDSVVGRSHAVKESDIADMVYLTAVVKEVLRLHPPGPLLSWSRLSIRDSVIDGRHVPAGTTAMVNMWAIMRDPDLWVDPLTFNPDRFFQGGSTAALDSDILRMAPFGSGRRSCPGKTLGLTTVTLWVATLLHEFEFLSSGPMNAPVDLTELLRLSCEMANPLHVRVRPRCSRINVI